MTTQLKMWCGSPYPIPTPNLITILNFVFIISIFKKLKNVFLNDILSDFFLFLYFMKMTSYCVDASVTFFSVRPFIFKFFFYCYL